MDETEEVKQEVSKPIHEPIGTEPLPHELSHEVIDIEKMVDETPRAAPLFVKVDKYKEILDGVHKLRLSLKNIQFLLAFKDQIKRLDSENDELLYKTLQSLSRVVNEFSVNFSVPRGVSYVPRPPVEERADENVSDIGEKISKLREELEKIKI